MSCLADRAFRDGGLVVRPPPPCHSYPVRTAGATVRRGNEASRPRGGHAASDTWAAAHEAADCRFAAAFAIFRLPPSSLRSPAVR